MTRIPLSTASTRTRQRLAALSLCCLIALFLFGRFLTPGRMIADFTGGADHNCQAMFYFVAAKSMLSGVWPFWVSELGAGFPLWACFQYGIGSPFFLLFLLLPTELAYTTSAAMHLALAGFGMYLLACRLALTHREAMLASCAYAASSYFVGHVATGQTIISWPMAWFVWVVWSTDRLLAVPNTRRIVVAALFLAFGIISGHVQMAVYLMAFNLVFAGIRLWTTPGAAKPVTITALLGTSVLAVALAAVQWIPFLELWRVNGDLLPDFSVLESSMPPIDLWSLILPHPFGLGSERNLLYDSIVTENEWVCSSSAVIVWLTAIGLWSTRRRPLFSGVAILFAVGLLLGIGGYLPFYSQLVEFVPVVGGLRNPGRALFLSLFALALLSAEGMRTIDQRIEKSQSVRGPLLFGVGLLILTVIGACHIRSTVLPSNYPRYIMPQDKINGVLLRSLAGSWITITVALLTLVWAHRTARRGIWQYGIIVITLMGLLMEEGRRLVPMSSQPLYAPPPQRVLDDPIQDFRVTGYFSNAVMHDYDMVKASSVLLPSEYRKFKEHLTDNRLRILRARYDQHYINHLDFANRLPFRSSATKREPVYSSPTWSEPICEPLPKVHVYHDALIIPDTATSLAAIDEGRFSLDETLLLHDREWRTHLPNSQSKIVEHIDQLNVNLADPQNSSDEDHSKTVSTENAHIVKHAGTKITIQVNTSRPGWLFLSELDYPGWKARIENTSLPVVRAFVAFKAVPVPAGSYRVVLEYRPWSVRYGIGITVTALLVCVCLWFFRRELKQQSPIPPQNRLTVLFRYDSHPPIHCINPHPAETGCLVSLLPHSIVSVRTLPHSRQNDG